FSRPDPGRTGVGIPLLQRTLATDRGVCQSKSLLIGCPGRRPPGGVATDGLCDAGTFFLAPLSAARVQYIPFPNGPESPVMRLSPTIVPKPRRAVILAVVLAPLSLSAIVGLPFVFYPGRQAAAPLTFREARPPRAGAVPVDLLANYFLGQLVYDVP